MRRHAARSLAVSALVALAACAGAGSSTADFDRGMATYIGQPEIRLVEGLGVPQRVFETEGLRFLEYDLSSTAAPAASGFSFGVGAGSYSGGRYGRGGGFGTGIGLGIPLGGPGYGGYEAAPCIVTFTLREGRVLDYRRQGETCR